MSKPICILAAFFSFILFSEAQQNPLKLEFAEKFDYQDVLYEYGPDFDGPMVIANHVTDLSHFGLPTDPMGRLAGSPFSYEGDAFDYLGSFVSEGDVAMLDYHINDPTDHETVLLDVDRPCSLIYPNIEEIPFAFPELEGMNGIVNFNEEAENGPFFISYLVAQDGGATDLWGFGELTIISGKFNDSLKYYNPDGSEIDVTAISGFDDFVIAIDETGTFVWSYVVEGEESSGIKTVREHGGELVIAQEQFFFSRLVYLDTSGNESRDNVEFSFIGISDLGFDQDDNMLLCGYYYPQAENTNMDLSGGEYLFPTDFSEQANGFLIKTTPEGEVLWGQTIIGVGFNYILDLAFNDFFINVTGSISDVTSFGLNGGNEFEISDIQSDDIFVAEYTQDGTLQWVQHFESDGFERGLKIDRVEEDIFVFGVFDEELDADPSPNDEEILVKENEDIFVSNFFLHLTERELSVDNVDFEVPALSPNPASTYFSALDPSVDILSVSDITGNVVKKVKDQSVDVSNLTNGQYIVRCQKDGRIFHQRLVVLH